MVLIFICSLFEILQTLYFAFYGLVDVKHFELQENHEFTQFVGKLMFGTYSGIMIIVLINMLIAMLSTSFQLISVSFTPREMHYIAFRLLSFKMSPPSRPDPIKLFS